MPADLSTLQFDSILAALGVKEEVDIEAVFQHISLHGVVHLEEESGQGQTLAQAEKRLDQLCD